MFKWLYKKKGCAKHMNNKLEVIGIDHGWSMMKTISQVFVTGVKEITTTPALFGDVLEYEGKFYKVGTVRQEVKDTKVEDDSFYLLTLAAVAKELKRRGLAEAMVFLAVGLPLTRFGAEKNDFIKYLTKNKRVSFKYENEPYHIEIDDVAVFPQCYAAVVDKIPAMAKKTLIIIINDAYCDRSMTRDYDREALNVFFATLKEEDFEVVVVRSLNEITDDIYDLEEFVKTFTDMGIWLYSLEVGPVPITVSHAEDFGC